MRSNRRTQFTGNIESVRAVEDCIRATKKYTEGIGTFRKQHPIQGEDTTSRKFCKYYEVYPETEITWEMPAGKALDWLWGEVPCIDVVFDYDYRINKASVIIKDGIVALGELGKGIPGFNLAISNIKANGKKG